MLFDILNGILSIVDFFKLVVEGVVDFITNIPTYVGFVGSFFSSLPAFVAPVCGIALSLLIANKVLHLL